MDFALPLVVLLVLGVCLGSTVFLPLVIAPVVFATLGAGHPGAVLRGVFPRYHGLGLGCSVAALAGLLALGVAADRVGGARVVATVSAALMICLTFGSWRLVPRIMAVGAFGEPGATRH